jgi:hypothetical protein
MKRSTTVPLTLLVLALFAPRAGAAEQPPERKALDAFVGSWTEEITIKPCVFVKEGAQIEGAKTTGWILGGRVLHTSSHARPGRPPSIFLVSRDPGQKTYHGWFSNLYGVVTNYVGRWDAAKKRMEWTAVKMKDGSSARVFWQVEGKDRHSWGAVVKNKDGKILLDMVGTATRAKSPQKEVEEP